MADKVDPFDVEALEKSLNDSATRVSALWISFLIFGLYLVIAAGTVTQEQLFLAEPVKLPVLNIDLPLVGFFFLAPILFVIFHAYVLLQVLLLGRTAAAYNEAVEHTIKVAADNARVRQRLANTLFAQIFAGSPRERDGWLGFLLKTMAWITLAIAPVLVLLVFQFKFLPYHSHLVTWTLRALILFELMDVFLLWPLALDPTRDIDWRRVIRNPFAWASVALFGFISLSLFTFPGEPHVNKFAGQPPDAAQCTRWFEDLPPSSFWSWLLGPFDRLSLPRVDVVDDEEFKKIEEHTKAAGERDYQGERTRLLRERNFDCANFSDADLRRVDLTYASLSGAVFDRSKLQGASFEGAALRDASLAEAHLQGALLKEADLQGVTFGGDDLGDMIEVGGVLLWIRTPRRAKLQGVSLEHALLQGASLAAVQLQGASLYGALLEDASLFAAQLQGAYLDGAQLQGASLDYANLQGASLDYANLQGASLRETRLQGAHLHRAQLQGTILTNALLTETTLSNVAVWHARDVNCKGARIQGSTSAAIIRVDWDNPNNSVRANQQATVKFIKDAVVDISDPDMKARAVDRMRAGLVVDPANNDITEIAEIWRNCEEESASVSQAEFDKKHAAFLRDLACNADKDRGTIAKGIIHNWISDEKDRWAFSAQLARGLLGEDGKPCAATKDLDQKDIKRLRKRYRPRGVGLRSRALASSYQGSRAMA